MSYLVRCDHCHKYEDVTILYTKQRGYKVTLYLCNRCKEKHGTK